MARVKLILASDRHLQGDEEEGDEPAELPEGGDEYEEDGDEVPAERAFLRSPEHPIAS